SASRKIILVKVETRLWDVSTGQEIRQYVGHKGTVFGLAYALDGRSVASCGEDGAALVWDVTGLSPEGELRKLRLAPENLEAAWKSLASGDAGEAHRALWRMVAASEQALPFLKEHLRPVAAATPARLAQLITELDSEKFETRSPAARELAELRE